VKKDYKIIQAEFRQKAKPKFHPKGTKVPYKTREGVKAEYANDPTMNQRGKLFQDRSKSKKGATHKVNPPEVVKDFFPPQMTNHDKMIWRKDQRQAKLAK
jgi:hypothetical protein